jgi:hypothetical protein
MSVATAFIFPRLFPFCVDDESAYYSGTGTDFDYVGNLTLAEVMALFWNLETFTIETAGTITDAGGSAGGATSLTLNPIAGTPWDEGYSEGAWYDFGTVTAFASWPAFRAPRDRICHDYAATPGAIASIDVADSGGNGSAFLDLALSTDPSNAGKYRLYYRFQFVPARTGSSPPTLTFSNPASNLATAIASGTFAIGGITLNWEANDQDAGTTPAGLDMTASSSDFTY